MSAAPRSIQAAPSFGPLIAAFAAILLAMAFALLLAYGQLGSSQAASVPLNPGAQNAHDHGWSRTPSTAAAAQYAHDHGWSVAPAAGAAPILNDNGWATAPSTNSTPAGGGNGTRFAR